jgi:hypothetical protein
MQGNAGSDDRSFVLIALPKHFKSRYRKPIHPIPGHEIDFGSRENTGAVD